jgi:hypothetical protein
MKYAGLLVTIPVALFILLWGFPAVFRNDSRLTVEQQPGLPDERTAREAMFAARKKVSSYGDYCGCVRADAAKRGRWSACSDRGEHRLTPTYQEPLPFGRSRYRRNNDSAISHNRSGSNSRPVISPRLDTPRFHQPSTQKDTSKATSGQPRPPQDHPPEFIAVCRQS